jgi:hypothetical protein
MNPPRKRPRRHDAQCVIERFFQDKLGEVPPYYRLIHDGDDSWSFWILDDDTTSYVHHDLKIEWLGTAWEPGDEQP